MLSAIALTTVVAISSCQQKAKDVENNPQELSAKAIEVHDEIMPQISTFDKHTVVIDSLLTNLAVLKTDNPTLDTVATRTELSTLKDNLEQATDKMMVWMHEYTTDSTDTEYQKAEIKRISDLKTEFEKVTSDANRILAPFTKKNNENSDKTKFTEPLLFCCNRWMCSQSR